MPAWFWYAIVAAVLYGAHQIFTRMAADHIGEGLGGFIVEATAALSILLYLVFVSLLNRWNQQSSAQGIFYSVLTGICVGAGTIAFFLLFQKGGPLSSVPAILAGGGNHGRGWHFVFSRNVHVAENYRHCVCYHRLVFAAQIASKAAKHSGFDGIPRSFQWRL